MKANTLTIGSTVALLAALSVAALPMFASAAAPEKTEAFVCPVLNETVGAHNPNTFEIADGDYSLIPSGTPHTIMVPAKATNDNGAGSPGGDHVGPGDPSYTAIWSN